MITFIYSFSFSVSLSVCVCAFFFFLLYISCWAFRSMISLLWQTRALGALRVRGAHRLHEFHDFMIYDYVICFSLKLMRFSFNRWCDAGCWFCFFFVFLLDTKHYMAHTHSQRCSHAYTQHTSLWLSSLSFSVFAVLVIQKHGVAADCLLFIILIKSMLAKRKEKERDEREDARKTK